MRYTLLIVESPSKCGKIEKYLGDSYKCVASYGHIRELNGLKSIDITNNFTPKYSIIENKIKQISKIKKMIKCANDILLATDDDREGEAIAWHICDVFNLPLDTKRIKFNEITKTALNKSILKASVIDMNIVNAQKARQILDLIVGYKLSPMLWKNISYKYDKGLSVGRCQTPALRIIYDNQKEIDNNLGEKMYNTSGYFTNKNISFTLNNNYKNELDIIDFLEKSVNYEHMFNIKEHKDLIRYPPLPLTTSRLQQASNNKLNISPKETMSICQKLYECGYITYMRTDSMIYSNDFINNTSKYIKNKYGKEYINKNINELNCKKSTNNNTQDAHEAIRPTNINISTISFDNITKKEINMYKLIRNNSIESCMSDSNTKLLTCVITAPNKYIYKYSTEQVIFGGWKEVNGYEKINNIYSYLLNLKKNTIFNYNTIISKITIKKNKSHINESRLVQILESKGIGRPSTYSSIIDKIQNRGYVKKMDVKGIKTKCKNFQLNGNKLIENEIEEVFGNEKNKLIIQPVGIIVLEFILNIYDELFRYEYTKKMEEELDAISTNDKIWYELCRKCLNKINELSNNIETNNIETNNKIKIDDNNVYMIGKYGPVIRNSDNGNITFKKARQDIDIEKIKQNKYKLCELINNTEKYERIIGQYNKNNVVIKSGRYGLYITCGDLNISLNIDKNKEEIKLEDILHLLKTNNTNIIREIKGKDLSIRKGKFGDYIYYKKKNIKKPKFIKLQGFKYNYIDCDIQLIKDYINKNT